MGQEPVCLSLRVLCSGAESAIRYITFKCRRRPTRESSWFVVGCLSQFSPDSWSGVRYLSTDSRSAVEFIISSTNKRVFSYLKHYDARQLTRISVKKLQPLYLRRVAPVTEMATGWGQLWARIVNL